MDAPGNGGNASMPEEVKRPNPWRKMKMMMMIKNVVKLEYENVYLKAKPFRIIGDQDKQLPDKRSLLYCPINDFFFVLCHRHLVSSQQCDWKMSRSETKCSENGYTVSGRVCLSVVSGRKEQGKSASLGFI